MHTCTICYKFLTRHRLTRHLSYTLLSLIKSNTLLPQHKASPMLLTTLISEAQQQHTPPLTTLYARLP